MLPKMLCHGNATKPRAFRRFWTRATGAVSRAHEAVDPPTPWIRARHREAPRESAPEAHARTPRTRAMDLKSMINDAKRRELSIYERFSQYDKDGSGEIDEVRRRRRRGDAAKSRARVRRRARGRARAFPRRVSHPRERHECVHFSHPRSPTARFSPPHWQAELCELLNDLNILSADSARDQEFMARQLFQIHDINGDGTINFEEFKVRAHPQFPPRVALARGNRRSPIRSRPVSASVPDPRSPVFHASFPSLTQAFYNAALDFKRQDKGRFSGPIRGKDEKALSPAVESARRETAQRRAEEKAAAAAQLAAENREAKRRISMARSAGRDAKALTPEMEDARAAIAARKASEKAQMERDLAAQNAEMRRRIEENARRGRDAKALTPEMEEARARVRRESLNFKAQAGRDLAAQNAEMRRRIAEAMEHGRDAKSLSPEAEAGRAAVAARSREEKDAAARRLADENLATAVRLTEAMRHGRDAKSLSPETRAYRRAVAEKSRTDKAAAEAKLRRENAALAARLAGTGKYPDPFF